MRRTREEHAAYMRAYLDDPAHPERREKKRAADRARYARNPESARKQAREWHAQNRDRAREIRKRSFERNKQIVALEAEARGGRCEADGCEIADRLQWHHIDPTTKRFALSESKTYSVESVKAELAKCKLLCAGHHLLAHHENGTGAFTHR